MVAEDVVYTEFVCSFFVALFPLVRSDLLHVALPGVKPIFQAFCNPH